MCLKSFEKYSDLTHLLLYTNTTEDAELAKKYIDEILLLNILPIPKHMIYVFGGFMLFMTLIMLLCFNSINRANEKIINLENSIEQLKS